MNPELFICYQELADLCDSKRNCEYESFRIRGRYDESGLALSLKYIEKDGTENQLTPVPIEAFDIMEKINAASEPLPIGTVWIFDYNRDGKYNISVKYPDGSEPEINRP